MLQSGPNCHDIKQRKYSLPLKIFQHSHLIQSSNQIKIKLDSSSQISKKYNRNPIDFMLKLDTSFMNGVGGLLDIVRSGPAHTCHLPKSLMMLRFSPDYLINTTLLLITQFLQGGTGMRHKGAQNTSSK